MVGYYRSLCNKKKNWKNWKIKKLFAVATSKFPEFLIDQSNRIWSETFTANKGLKSRQSKQRIAPCLRKVHIYVMKAMSSGTFLALSSDNSYIYFSLTSMLHFFLLSIFLSLSSSGASDGTTGIYYKSLSVFFLCKSLFDNVYTLMHSSYLLSFVSPWVIFSKAMPMPIERACRWGCTFFTSLT